VKGPPDMADADANMKEWLLKGLGRSLGPAIEGSDGPAPGPGPPVIPDHTLLRPIGKGSYGEVWLARNALGAFRAVKIVHRRNFDSERPYEREFEGIRRFEPISRSHPSQLHVLHVGRDADAGMFYYVMELADDAGSVFEAVDGGGRGDVAAPLEPAAYEPRTLRSDLRRRGRLPGDECLQIGLALATALDHLHRHGLVHRDIKPSNIVFVGGIPKLADIGLVTHVEATASFVGTEGYLPPEGPGAPQADIFGLGKVLYEMASGRDRQDYPELPTNLIEAPPAERVALAELNEIILRACHRDVRQRYQTAAEFHADLALLQSGRSVSRQRALARRLLWVQRAGAAVTALAVVIAAGWFWQARQTRRFGDMVQEKERQRRQAQENLYFADIRAAYHDWESGQITRMLAELQRHLPTASEPDTRGWEWYYLLSLCYRDEKTLSGHTGAVLAVSCDPKRYRFASGSKDRTVRIWDALSGKTTAELKGHEDAVVCVAWSPDGARIASGGDDGKLILWDAQDFRKLFVLDCEKGVSSLAWSPDGKRVAAGGIGNRPINREGLVTIWDATSGARLHSLTGDVGYVWSLAWQPAGKLLVSGENYQGRLQVWDADKGELLRTLPGHAHAVAALAWKPDGRQLASASRDQRIRIWNVENWEPVLTLDPAHDGAVTSLAWSDDGKRLISGGNDWLVKSWNPDTGALLNALRGHRASVNAVAWWPGRQRALSAGDDALLKLWDPNLNQAMRTLEDCACLAWSSDARRVAVAVWDEPAKRGEFQLLDTATWQPTLSFPTPKDQFPFSIALSPEGGRVAVCFIANLAGQLKVWDLATRNEILTLTNPVADSHGDRGFRTVAWSPDGKSLLTAGADAAARIWNIAAKEPVLTFREHAHLLSSAVWSPDGRRIVSKDWSGVVLIWEAATGRVLHNLRCPAGGIPGKQYDVGWSPQGDRIAAGGSDGAVMVWDAADGRELHTLKGHTSSVRSVQWSPNGRRLVSAAEDRTLRIWDPQIGGELLVLPDRPNRFPMVAWSPDGRRISAVDAAGLIFDATLGYEAEPRLAVEARGR